MLIFFFIFLHLFLLIHCQNIKNLIINGDFLDAEFLRVQDATTKKWINRPEGVDDYFIPKAQEEIRWGNDILDILQKYFKNIKGLRLKGLFEFLRSL